MIVAAKLFIKIYFTEINIEEVGIITLYMQKISWILFDRNLRLWFEHYFLQYVTYFSFFYIVSLSFGKIVDSAHSSKLEFFLFHAKTHKKLKWDAGN